MSVATLYYDVQAVRAARPIAGGSALTLADGREVFLDGTNPLYRFWLIYAESELRRDYPVAVLTDDEGRVIDLTAAHDTIVQRIEDSPTTPNCVRVGFWSYAPVCGLSRGHPEFRRIYATLVESAESRRRVHLATHTAERVVATTEDGEPCDLPKIMDVRFA